MPPQDTDPRTGKKLPPVPLQLFPAETDEGLPLPPDVSPSGQVSILPYMRGKDNPMGPEYKKQLKIDPKSDEYTGVGYKLTPWKEQAKKSRERASDPEFPLLSKSPGFEEAMKEGEPTPKESTLPRDVQLQRNLYKMESSEFYKQADGPRRVRLQTAFYNKFVHPMVVMDKSKMRPETGFWTRFYDWVGLQNEDQPITLQKWLQSRGKEWLKDHPNPAMQTGDISKIGLGEWKTMFSLESGFMNLPADAAHRVMDDWVKFNEEKDYINNFQNNPVGPHLLPKPHQEIKKLYHYNPELDGTTLDEWMKISDWTSENYYRDRFYDKALRFTGENLPTIPLFMAGDEIFEVMGLPGRLGIVGKAGRPVFNTLGEKATYFAAQSGRQAILDGANGFLVGLVPAEKHPAEDAINMAVGGFLLRPVLGAVGIGLGKGWSGANKFVARTLLWSKALGGDKGVEEIVGQVAKDVINKEPHTRVTNAAVAMAGNQKQKVSLALFRALDEMSGGNFSKMPLEEKAKIIESVKKNFPNLAAEAGAIDENITLVQAKIDEEIFRAANPAANELLTNLEALDKEPTSATIAKDVADKEKATLLRNNADKPSEGKGASVKLFVTKRDEEALRGLGWIQRDIDKLTPEQVGDILNKKIPPPRGVGAARADSLEFSDNFSKHVDNRLDQLGLGKDKFTWESRGHKLLFYLNVLASDVAEKGPSLKADTESKLLMHQLNQEFPNKSLEELLAMSDKLWTKIYDMEKQGLIKPGVPTKIWRQTHLEPGESPFAHEVDMVQKAAKQDADRRVVQHIERTDATRQQIEDENLRKAFAQSGDKGTGKVDTRIHADTTEQLFPGRRYEDLSPKEQSQVNQAAAKASKAVSEAEKRDIREGKAEGGKVKLSSDTDAVADILSTSIYSYRGARIVTREALQNAYDSVRGMAPGTGKVNIHFDEGTKTVTVTDNGKGMNPDEVYNKLTEIGGSGKTDDPTSTGGFGIGSGTFFTIPKETHVVTVGREADGSLTRMEFTSDPKSIKKGVDPKITRNMPASTKTGTTIKTTYETTDGFMGALDFAKRSQASRRAPTELKITKEPTTSYEKYMWKDKPGNIKHDFEVADVPMGSVNVPGKADLDFYQSSKADPIGIKRGGVYVDVENNGVFQYSEWMQTGNVRGLPERVVLDVRAIGKERTVDYPFKADRESMQEDVKKAFQNAFEQKILKPLRAKTVAAIDKVYDNLPKLKNTAGVEMPIFDSGQRMTPVEIQELQNNRALQVLGTATNNIVQSMKQQLSRPEVQQLFGKKLGPGVERVGFLFSKGQHGVNVPNVKTPGKNTVFINPFLYHIDSNDEIASLMFHTLKHEVLHDVLGDHDESFTTGEAKISHFLGADFEIYGLRSMKEAYEQARGPNLRKDYNRAVQIYEDSRTRSATTEDLLGGQTESAK